MNKTLLLVICDFLLLNLLALTRWEKAEPVTPPGPQVQAGDVSGNTSSRENDVVEAMRMSLEDERAQRSQLADQLKSTSQSLAEREQSLNTLQGERQTLAQNLTTVQQEAAKLNQQVQQAAQDASVSKERLAQLQKELEEREAAAKRQASQLADLEKQQGEARQRIENLSVAVKVAEQEKSMLKETAEVLRQQVDVERTERAKVQETTTQLAQGVGQLAQSSTEMTKEIRENRPIGANVLFNDFLANRATVKTSATRKGLFGAASRDASTDTILVTDGRETYALTHIDDTPFIAREPFFDWTKFTVSLRHGSEEYSTPLVHFLSLDPRVVAYPVAQADVERLGAKVYKTALDPFKFNDAVLISKGGAGYGEVSFKLDAANPGYVRMDNRLMKRLFGDFAPSRGDIVISRTGELLGIMVNSDFCAVVSNFLPTKTVRTGEDIAGEKTGDTLRAVASRVMALPFNLQ